MSLANELLDAIEIIVQQAIKNNTTQIYNAVCQSVETNKNCIVLLNGKENMIRYYGADPIVGDTYRVFVPSNNMSMAFIIVPSA